jgi:hypothetical protein
MPEINRNFVRQIIVGRVRRNISLGLITLAILLGVEWTGLRAKAVAVFQDEPQDTGETHKVVREDCNFLREPQDVRAAMARHREEISKATDRISLAITRRDDIELAAPQDIPRKNFIDNILFDRMVRDNIMSAPVCTDEQFIRRASLDITGRIPSADEVKAFLADTSANKRDALVDRLVGSPEYVDKWTMFFGDLFKNTLRSTNVVRYSGGRDAFHTWIKNSVAANKSYAQMATEMITANGDNFVAGQTNFIIGGIIPMGPAQDTMDGTAVAVGSTFLGINSLDCLYCHDGAGHLDSVNLWGAQRTRHEAWGMAAYFSRTQRTSTLISSQPLYRKFTVSEASTGEYRLNTTTGNRTARQPVDGQNTVTPRYILNPNAAMNNGENRRQALARIITSDDQFARAAVNYIWEKLMVEALVSPSNTFDLARLSASASLPGGWSVQPANPELLESLAQDFKRNNFDIRKLIATIVKSSAYQLSTQYPGNWNLSLVPYYARKYVRRMDAEEIHDAILKATGIGVTYQMRDTLGQNTYTVNWAMQLPDPVEPRTNGAAAAFLNSFLRGDRDVKLRSPEPSILQSLNLMNNSLVMTRIHQANAGSNVQKLLADTTLTPTQIITRLYLNTLSRNPSPSEISTLLPLYSSQTRTVATESVQWILLNKMDFIFNY